MPNRYSYALVLSYYQSRGIIEKSPFSESSASPLDLSQALPNEQATLESPPLDHISSLSDPGDSSIASKAKDQPRPSRHSASSSVTTEIWAPQGLFIPCAQSHTMIETSNEKPLPPQCPSWGNLDPHDQKTEICSNPRKGQPRAKSREKIIMRSSNYDCRRRRSYKRLDYEYRDAVQDLLTSMQPVFSPAKNTPSNYLISPSNYGDQSSEIGKASQKLPATIDNSAIDEAELPDSPDLDVVPWEYSPITATRHTSSVRTEENEERRLSQTHVQPLLSVLTTKVPGNAIERSDTKSQEHYSQCFPGMNTSTALDNIETRRPTLSRSWTEDTVFLPTYPRNPPASVSAHTPVDNADAPLPTEVPRRSTSLSSESFPLEFYEAEHVALAALAERQRIDEGIWFKRERTGGRRESPDDDVAPPPIKLRRHKGRS
ncbi:MAG: hypothetical protein Q9214_006301 [Letrouitia sp. 1 TL-2023]